jgi:hypothetical protein
MNLISAGQGQMLSCLVIVHSNEPHLAQLHTGLAMLAQQGKIRLAYKFGDFRWGANLISRNKPPVCGLYIVIDGQGLAYFDLRDGAGLDAHALGIADLYFKRSYSLETTPFQHRHKVIPLGLNYEVYPDAPGVNDFKRLMAHRRFSRPFLRACAQFASQLSDLPFVYVPKVSHLRADPAPEMEPRVLFMVRAWDPEQEKDLPPAVKDDRRTINEMRAACIRLLRKTHGELFTGGFAHTPYAIKHYKDVLLKYPELARQDRYVSLIKKHAICIATTGLHGSVGWKFGEYVACSRAIVSETLQFLPPEGYVQGQHFLDFSTPDECVNATESLMSDPVLRSTLMNNNRDYYQKHLTPDALVWRALTIAKEWGSEARNAAKPQNWQT